MTTYGVVPYPDPPLHSAPCTGCEGKGVTGDQYAMQTDRVPLLVDVFCPKCGGCGNSDHSSCAPGAHPAFADRGEEDDWDGDDQEEQCPSCEGRTWNAVQTLEDDDEGNMLYVRVPCGCMTDRVEMVEVEA